MKKTSKKGSGKKLSAAAASAASAAAPAGPQRLDKLLGQEGLGTRSELKKAVRKGRVTVNGAVEKDPGRQITAEDRICFDGKEVRRNQYVYYMLNKPAGVITATEDGRMRTVLDLLREPVPVPEEAEPGSAAADSPEETETSVPHRPTSGSGPYGLLPWRPARWG